MTKVKVSQKNVTLIQFYCKTDKLEHESHWFLKEKIPNRLNFYIKLLKEEGLFKFKNEHSFTFIKRFKVNEQVFVAIGHRK